MNTGDHVVAMGRPVEVHRAERGGPHMRSRICDPRRASGDSVVDLILRIVDVDSQLLSQLSLYLPNAMQALQRNSVPKATCSIGLL